jgi:hypothetical protein
MRPHRRARSRAGVFLAPFVTLSDQTVDSSRQPRWLTHGHTVCPQCSSCACGCPAATAKERLSVDRGRRSPRARTRERYPRRPTARIDCCELDRRLSSFGRGKLLNLFYKSAPEPWAEERPSSRRSRRNIRRRSWPSSGFRSFQNELGPTNTKIISQEPYQTHLPPFRSWQLGLRIERANGIDLTSIFGAGARRAAEGDK